MTTSLPPPTDRAAPAPAARLDLRGCRILSCDDDRLNARILSGILRPEGFELRSVETGEAVLETYPLFQPDLVLLDVMLPGINGFETCRRLKAAHGDQCAPVIFITAKTETEGVVEGFDAGGVDYLPKPFRAKETLARIRAHLQNRLLVGQLSKANAAKNRLLGMAAHDLRNPLASIRALADYLRDGTVGALTPDQLDLVNHIHSASQAMLQLVNELLDTSVIEPCALGELVEQAIYLNNINAAQKGTKILLRPGPLPPALPLDPAKIRQVLDNLLSNAVKFSPPGSVVTVVTTTADGHCVVAVRDRGPGIPEGERHRLFQDFGRTSVRPTGGEKSTGLGLAICRKIIEAHGGAIGADNLPEGGAEFRLRLPLSA
jgi:signal transduction histidine kinase